MNLLVCVYLSPSEVKQLFSSEQSVKYVFFELNQKVMHLRELII